MRVSTRPSVLVAEDDHNVRELVKMRLDIAGYEVYTAQERSAPTVTIQVWYRVGSKDDPEGRSGFAHLFEHIMFKSTANLRAEQFDRLTEDVGGANNASTGDDMTEYHEVVPSNHLETLLWAEAERMGSLTVDEANFKSERDVVKEEFRQNDLVEICESRPLSRTKRWRVTRLIKRPEEV